MYVATSIGTCFQQTEPRPGRYTVQPFRGRGQGRGRRPRSTSAKMKTRNSLTLTTAIQLGWPELSYDLQNYQQVERAIESAKSFLYELARHRYMEHFNQTNDLPQLYDPTLFADLYLRMTGLMQAQFDVLAETALYRLNREQLGRTIRRYVPSVKEYRKAHNHPQEDTHEDSPYKILDEYVEDPNPLEEDPKTPEEDPNHSDDDRTGPDAQDKAGDV